MGHYIVYISRTWNPGIPFLFLILYATFFYFVRHTSTPGHREASDGILALFDCICGRARVLHQAVSGPTTNKSQSKQTRRMRQG
jgi:hypothetical protein